MWSWCRIQHLFPGEEEGRKGMWLGVGRYLLSIPRVFGVGRSPDFVLCLYGSGCVYPFVFIGLRFLVGWTSLYGSPLCWVNNNKLSIVDWNQATLQSSVVECAHSSIFLRDLRTIILHVHSVKRNITCIYNVFQFGMATSTNIFFFSSILNWLVRFNQSLSQWPGIVCLFVCLLLFIGNNYSE